MVIGGSTGIGAALAERLAAQGHRVFATFNRHERPDRGSLSFHRCDVLDPQPDLSFLPDVVHGLAYCPGSITLKAFARLSADDFVQDYRLQVVGAVSVLQRALPHLKRADRASVVLFSSVAASTGFGYHAVVASSKGAIEGLTVALAAEWAPRIRVNAIAPSLTNTPLAATLLSTPEKTSANAQRHPLKRVGEPADLAATAAFLLSDDSSWMTGQVLHADGGIGRLRV